MSNRELLSNVIAHWERMLKYAEKQIPEDKPKKQKMKQEIGENWTGEFCAFCIEYYYWKSITCKGCPVKEHDLKCTYASSLWSKVNTSSTWKEWIMYAKQILRKLKIRRRYYN